MEPKAQPVPLYSLGTTAALCGVDAATLRNWELRYALLRPRIDSDGERFYAEADLDRIRRIIALLDSGLPIHQIAARLAGACPPASPSGDDQAQIAWESLRGELRRAIASFDDHELQLVYHHALATYPMGCVLRHMLLPVLEEYGPQGSHGRGRIAEEHFFSFFLRNKLGARFHHRRGRNYGPLLLAACLPGDQHELGLLLFALCAVERGYRVCVLGANTPLPEAALAARRSRAQAVVLSSFLPQDTTALKPALPEFLHALPVPVFIGGQFEEETRRRYEALGLVVLADRDPEKAVEVLGAHLARCA